jgi:hypothetical protein
MADFANANAEPADDDSPVAAHNWPILKAAALQGVCGEIVTAIMPCTEADPAAITATLLTAVGCMAGRYAHALAANDQHPARLSALICGPTADGAKGTSWSTVKAVLNEADPIFVSANLASGAVSGEGVIELVRDGVGDDPDAKDFDEGVPDKRLLLIEEEFASVLAKGARHGSSLMPILRQAWDGGTLRSSARKTNKLCATEPHISMIAHVTPGEFRARLSAGEVEGGTVNRMLIILSRRSKELPDGGNLPDTVRKECARKIGIALKDAKSRLGPMTRTDDADVLWREHYPRLVAAKPDGWFASATARSQAQVLRLSVAYAMLDGSTVIAIGHLLAALALWDYAESSARVLFAEVGYEVRQADSEKVVAFIAEHGEVTRNDLCDKLFSKHKKSHEVDVILQPLISSGRLIHTIVKTDGRPKTVYSLRNTRVKRESGISPLISDGGPELPRLSRSGAGKDSGTTSLVDGHSPLTPLTPPTEAPQRADVGAKRTTCGCSRPAPISPQTGLCAWCAVKVSKGDWA